MLCHRPSVSLERDDAADLLDRVGQRRRRRHDQRRRRRQAQRPHAAHAQVGRGADGSIVGALHAVRHLAREQAAEDQAEAPRHERREHREQADVGGGARPRGRHLRQRADHRVDRRRRGHGVAGDDDHRHLHREGDEVPEAGAETLRSFERRAAGEDGGPGHHRRGREGEREGVGKPALEPVREPQAERCEIGAFLRCFLGIPGFRHLAANIS